MIELSAIREAAQKHLTEYRFRHTLGCEKAAVALARRWGADETLCAAAALLHDWTKECTREQQLKLCEEYGIIPLEIEKIAWKTLHEKTAAAIAERDFFLPEEAAQAIACHTTGRTGMTLLDQIIYLADFIEENRTFDGVETARSLVQNDLTEAMLYCLEFSLKDLIKRRLLIHPASVEALNELYRQRG